MKIFLSLLFFILTARAEDLSRIGGFGATSSAYVPSYGRRTDDRDYERFHPSMNQDEHRKITLENGEVRYVDLYPLFHYAWLTRNLGDPAKSPQPGWIPIKIQIIQGAANGVLGKVDNLNLPAGNIFIKNVPHAEHLIDGRVFYCFATPAGVFRYTTVLGAKSTVPCYDYGEPLDTAKGDIASGTNLLIIPYTSTNLPPITNQVAAQTKPQKMFIK